MRFRYFFSEENLIKIVQCHKNKSFFLMWKKGVPEISEVPGWNCLLMIARIHLE